MWAYTSNVAHRALGLTAASILCIGLRKLKVCSFAVFQPVNLHNRVFKLPFRFCLEILASFLFSTGSLKELDSTIGDEEVNVAECGSPDLTGILNLAIIYAVQTRNHTFERNGQPGPWQEPLYYFLNTIQCSCIQFLGYRGNLGA